MLHVCSYVIQVLIFCRHLQADSWKIVSGADDKTLKVSSICPSISINVVEFLFSIVLYSGTLLNGHR